MALLSPLDCGSPLCPQNLTPSLAHSRVSIINDFQLLLSLPRLLARGDIPQQTTVTGTESDCPSAGEAPEPRVRVWLCF